LNWLYSALIQWSVLLFQSFVNVDDALMPKVSHHAFWEYRPHYSRRSYQHNICRFS
jgi:hypothetical protein